MSDWVGIVQRRDVYRLWMLPALSRRVALNVTDAEGIVWRVVAVGLVDEVVELKVGLGLEGWLVAWLGMRAIATHWRLRVAGQRMSASEAAEALTWGELLGSTRPLDPSVAYRCDGWLGVGS